MKTYNAFRKQVERIETENDLKAAHITIAQACSAYQITWEQFMKLREMMIAKRTEKGFAWGKGI